MLLWVGPFYLLFLSITSNLLSTAFFRFKAISWQRFLKYSSPNKRLATHTDATQPPSGLPGYNTNVTTLSPQTHAGYWAVWTSHIHERSSLYFFIYKRYFNLVFIGGFYLAAGPSFNFLFLLRFKSLTHTCRKLSYHVSSQNVNTPVKAHCHICSGYFLFK